MKFNGRRDTGIVRLANGQRCLVVLGRRVWPLQPAPPLFRAGGKQSADARKMYYNGKEI